MISNSSVSLCEGFSRFFCDKITTLRSQLQPLANVSPELCCSSAIWSDFDPVSLQSLKENYWPFETFLLLSWCSPSTYLKKNWLGLDLVWCRLWVNFWFQELYLIASKKLLWHLFLRNLFLILVILIISNLPFITKALEKTVFKAVEHRLGLSKQPWFPNLLPSVWRSGYTRLILW